MLPDVWNSLPMEWNTILILMAVSLTIRLTKEMTFLFMSIAGKPLEDLSPRLNLDKYGMPQDYASYVWLLYKKKIDDDSPNRRAFLQKPKSGSTFVDEYFGFNMQYSEY